MRRSVVAQGFSSFFTSHLSNNYCFGDYPIAVMGSVGQAILIALASASDPDPGVRHRGEAQLLELKANPHSFFTSCAELLVDANVPVRGRQLVGFMLKNSLSHPCCVQNPGLQNSVMTQAVVDADFSIRSVACTIISCAVRDGHWPVDPVVKVLTEIITTRRGDISALHGAMRALSQIVDDCVQLLDMRRLTGAVVEAILPFLQAPVAPGREGEEVQLGALEAMAILLEQAGMEVNNVSYASLQPHALTVLESCLHNLQNPPSDRLATRCVKCLVLVLCFHEAIPDHLFHNLANLMSLMMTSVEGRGEEIRIEATEFWRGCLCFPRFATLIEPMLDSLIPVLIHSMVYSEMEIGMLQANAEDWNVPDKIDEIRPRHYQARVNDTAADEDEDGGDGDGDEVEEWNLRRVSALTLDTIAEYYGERIVFTVLTSIDDMMQPSKPWQLLEAAILALGAIMDGCFSFMTPYLKDISDRLLQLLRDPSAHFLVVSISLWTGTQIGQYFVSDAEILKNFLTCVLQRMQSPSKLVQESATAALQKIINLCDDGQLSNEVPVIVGTIAQCLRGYQLKNRVLLLETLETVCDVLEEPLRSSPDSVEALMGPLGAIWSETSNDSPLIFSFFSCMSGVCRAIGPSIQPALAREVFERSYQMLLLHVQKRAEAKQLGEDPPEYEFLVTSGDLLSGLFDALGGTLEPLVEQCNPALISTVLQMTLNEDIEVRRSGFSLLGDVAKNVPVLVQQRLGDVVKSAMDNLADFSDNTSSVASNVAWCLCNLLENQMDVNGVQMLDVTNGLPQLFAAIAHILGGRSLTADMRNMVENMCVCLGYMLYTNPEVESISGCPLELFAERFCMYMRNVKDGPHTEAALKGFIGATRQKVPFVVGLLHLFFDLAISVASSSAELKGSILELLNAAKAHNPSLWQEKMLQYSEQLRVRLYHVYGIQ
ncbi:hypothetical protein, conserved [Trypanosoma brucei gambiense DAL972]|uniref:Transportin 1 n=1 Tax=Trypanosoma brucei gambiense (strain MHOM/CI/86/DAL972) TaxID=679716 RepID=C9ZZC4_TRYB9|nr:hypothetical protein, conserved [Trypanosoma brucei gambiense DAL972]CBH14773.1 hypothetical protein, conserved [Trypanosoma brucei gambiense DAL972]|eukprot:XP_011777039.1 hypothetical protein, conserved [Trypanosoma brucei gambiense DAL972]